MKSLLSFVIIFTTLYHIGAAQRPAIDFYRQHKRLDHVRNFKIPGWLIWVGTGIAHDITNNEETKALLKVARKVKKLRLMIAEENNPIPVENVQHFVSESRRNGFSDLIYVRDGETSVNIIGKIKKDDKFRELVFMVSEADEFIFFHMKSNIRMKDVQQLIDVFLDDLSVNDETRRAEKEKSRKNKRKKQKLPQA